jgi:hypothetical protein
MYSHSLWSVVAPDSTDAVAQLECRRSTNYSICSDARSCSNLAPIRQPALAATTAPRSANAFATNSSAAAVAALWWAVVEVAPGAAMAYLWHPQTWPAVWMADVGSCQTCLAALRWAAILKGGQKSELTTLNYTNGQFAKCNVAITSSKCNRNNLISHFAKLIGGKVGHSGSRTFCRCKHNLINK